MVHDILDMHPLILLANLVNLGSLDCDNRTVYNKKSYALQNAASQTDELISAIFCLKPQF